MKAQSTTQTKKASTSVLNSDRSGILQRKCTECGQHTIASSECSECQKQKLPLQRRSDHKTEPNPAPPIVHEVLASPGKAIDPETKGFMESRFGQDFSRVRIHTNQQAASSAQAVNAQAYTVGDHVVFASDQYQPKTKAGRSLLAHELTHTLQQGVLGIHRKNIGIAEMGWAEQEAEQNASQIENGGRLSISSSPVNLYRQTATSVTVSPAVTPNSCLPHTQTIMSALQTGMTWLDSSIARLGSYIAAPANEANRGTAATLQRHFRTNSVSVARLVVQRLRIIRAELSQREPAARDPSDPAAKGIALECHNAADQTCGSAEAYIPGNDRLKMILCPSFLTSPSVESRAETLIHEIAHTILHPGGNNITDRAYDTNRLAPLLTTAETLDNADSYSGLAQEIGSGAVSTISPPEDQISQECEADVRTQVQQAMAWIERWNYRSEVQVISNDVNGLLDTHLGGHTDEIKTKARDLFKRTRTHLSQPIKIKCDRENTGTRSAYFRAGADRSGAGMAIGGIIGGLLGGIAGALLAGIGGAILGGVLGGVVGLGIGALIGSAVSRPDRIHLSPTWNEEPLDQRRENLLAAIYEMLGESAGNAENYAKLAHAIHELYFSAAPPAPNP